MCSSSGQGGGPGKGQGTGDSPLDKAGNGQPRQRERTPSEPGEGRESPTASGDGTPSGNGPDPDTDQGNRIAGRPPDLAKERVPVDDASGRWGDLPVQLREVFRAQGADDLPPKYRDWIDGYYRRLQKVARR